MKKTNDEGKTPARISNLKVSEKTAKFIKVLQLLDETEGAYLEALEATWGEESGNLLFSERADCFTPIRRQIGKEIADRIIDFVEDPKDRNII